MNRNLKRQASQPDSGKASTKPKRPKKPDKRPAGNPFGDHGDPAIAVEPYKYQSLSTPATIRVFCLDPGEAEVDSLTGELTQFDRYEEFAKLGHRQEYTAVSYAWGQPDFSERIILNGTGNDQRSYLRITSTVKVMLEHFRKRHKKIYLWIDAICLNQNDEAEKAQQIPLMGEIYQQAHKSYFWLGLEDGFEAAKIFAYFRLLAATNSTRSATKKIMEDNPGVNYVKQIQQFSKRPWFFRRWILQEAGLSRHGHIWCGHQKIQYDLFVMACGLLNSKSTAETWLLRKLFAIETTVEIQKMMRCSTRPPTIHSLLWKFHQSHCSEEKDRIGALYGLFPSSMRPNLDLAAPYQQIYEVIAAELASSSPGELILHLAHFRPLRLTEGIRAPSWIPDWSQERLKPAFPVYEDSLGLSASGKVSYNDRLSVSKNSDNFRNSQATWLSFLNQTEEVVQSFRFIIYYSNDVSDTDNGHAKSPSYILSAVLRVQWFHPIADMYGMPIRTLLAISTAPEGTRVPITFMQELQLLLNSFREQKHLHRFCAFISNAVFVEFFSMKPLMECFHNLVGKDLTQFALSSGQLETRRLLNGRAVEELARNLFRHQLAIITCDYPGLYVVGPSTLRKNNRLIPLANSSSSGYGRKLATWEAKNNSIHENLIGVRLLDRPCSQNADKHQIDIQNSGDMPLEDKTRRSEMMPLRAIYVGLCVSFRPRTTMEEDSHSVWLRASNMREESKLAEQEGRPPPYVIDIV